MDFKKIMENKPLFYGIIAGVVILLLLVVVVGVSISSNANSKAGVVKEKVIKEFSGSGGPALPFPHSGTAKTDASGFKEGTGGYYYRNSQSPFFRCGI